MEFYPGISNGRPKNPDYSMTTERLATFKTWSPNGIVIEELSKAGFYATGRQDSVRCFYCGGGMQHWQQDDDPWIEHATHFPDCDYLKLCVGEEFIKRAQYENEKVTQESSCEHMKKRLVPDQLIEDLNSKASLLLMDKGYKQEDVEHAIERAREKHGYQGCDFCGGWIKDWKLCEDPYIQHAKYFPECDYVKLCMPNDLTNRTQHLNEQGMDKGCRQENVEQVFHRTSEKRERTKRSRRPSESLDFADKITAKKTRIRATGVSAELPASTAFTTTSAVMSETNFSFTAIAHSPVTPASAAVHQAASPVAPSTSRTTNCSPMTIFSEIIQEQDRVLEENRKLKDRVTCKICLDKDACIVFIPCGHMVSCIQCAHEQKTCAVCRGEIKDTIRVYPA